MLLLSKFKIEGHSMSPYLRNGQEVLVSSIPFIINQPKKEDVIVFKKYGKVFIKRVLKAENNMYLVEGDNKKDSLDSRNFGYIKNKDIIGKVIAVV